MKPYKAAVFHCHFPGCSKACKSAGGLTQHESTCLFNPANQFRFPSLPRTPSPFPWENNDATPPDTPQRQSTAVEVPPTPSQMTPRRSKWQTRGRYGVYERKHPYLDGESCGDAPFYEKNVYIL
jgi:hypothetical protein